VTKPQLGDFVKCDLTFQHDAVDVVEEGFIAGIASTPSTDLYGHKVLKGAFDDSIKRKGFKGPRGVKLLHGHDWNKVVGSIKRMDTVKDALRMEAQLFLDVPHVRDLHTVLKHTGGLSFSVGFMLEEFEFVEEKDIKSPDDAYLVIKSGDLMEVSIVTFPACLDAEMQFVKTVDTVSEFERALVDEHICQSRNQAHKFALWAKQNMHLFDPKPPVLVPPGGSAHPMLDAHVLTPIADLLAKAREVLRN
jgi:HK97 family phage prohead protease